MSETTEHRPIFNVLDHEQAEQQGFDYRVAMAADRAAKLADFETLAMYRKRRMPLPPRLAKFAAHTDNDFKEVPLATLANNPVGATRKPSIAMLRRADSAQNYKPSYSVRYEQHLAARVK